MGNREVAAAWAYHNSTKHSTESVHRSRHFLDWEIMPLPFKVYPQLDPIPLPRDFDTSSRPALAVIADPGTPVAGDGPPLTLPALARLLYFSAGVLRRRAYPAGDVFFRAQACTGNLHHIDLYLVCGDLPDLEAGVYHFSPHDFALRRLRAGDYRAAVVAATGDEPAIAHAPAIAACTSTFWRNAWKYQARTYRHCFWDNGTLLANLLSVAAAVELPARIVLGFADAEVNALFGLDTRREATMSLVALGRGGAPASSITPVIYPLEFETVPLSTREVDYPAIREAHAVSSLTSAAEVRAWRQPLPAADETPSCAALVPLAPAIDAAPEPIETVILRRGSTRIFRREPISFGQLSTILHAVTRGASADFLESGASWADLYLIVNAVDDVAPGAYVFDRRRGGLVCLRQGDFRREAGHLDLGQELAADAAANIYWLVDLQRVLDRFGNRGYRAAELEAAIEGGKTYLAAVALRLGATGLTFFDDDVTAFFSPHAEGKSVMFLMVVGKPERRRPKR
jgi:SagB-type dehydrogenase family enzyme